MKIVAFLVLALVTSAHAESRSFTVNSAPTGDAPQKVRDGWIGLTLPIAEIGACSYDIYGNLMKNPSELSYKVSQELALELLRLHSPESFRWWADNGLPVSSIAYFCFSTELVG